MNRNQPEIDLVRRAQVGDPEAFDTLVRRYQPGVRLVVAQCVPARHVDDAVQEALLAAYKVLPTMREPARFGPWLATIAHRRAIRYLEGPSELTGLDQMIVRYVPAIVDRIVEGERDLALRRAIEALPPDLKSVVSLHYGEEWPVRQISDFLNLPVTTIKWRLHEARRLLRKELQGKHP
jgi:RNA polymerase sigma-70 factor (ECF subfamily)